jgi:hypothetical protein
MALEFTTSLLFFEWNGYNPDDFKESGLLVNFKKKEK